jgi:hypothetical protein
VVSAGHGEKRSRKQDLAIAALLTEPTVEAAARRAGVGVNTLHRWLRDPDFTAAYRTARRGAVEAAVARIQGSAGAAVDTLTRNLTCGRPGDEIRAAVAILDHAGRGLAEADLFCGDRGPAAGPALGTHDVVQLLAARLRQLDQSELPVGEKSRLTAALADALLRAIGVGVLDKRLEALQAVLIGRKDTERR